MATGDEDYDLVMPFVTVASKGGPHDDAAYTAGYEMGLLSATLQFDKPTQHHLLIHTENVRQADLIAMRENYLMSATPPHPSGWTDVLLLRIRTIDRPAAR